jgi:ABC-type methionine transport system ATPase subunit
MSGCQCHPGVCLYNAQVLQACKIETDLVGMPEGDATWITSSGDNLSGGQRARINLARALYTEADIYLLDGVLAALDSQVSSAVLHSVFYGPLTHKATVLLVSNNLKAVACADMVIELQNGALGSRCALPQVAPKNRGGPRLANVFANVFGTTHGSSSLSDTPSLQDPAGQVSCGSGGASVGDADTRFPIWPAFGNAPVAGTTVYGPSH